MTAHTMNVHTAMPHGKAQRDGRLKRCHHLAGEVFPSGDADGTAAWERVSFIFVSVFDLMQR